MKRMCRRQASAYLASTVSRAAWARIGHPMKTASLISSCIGIASRGVPSASKAALAAACRRQSRAVSDRGGWASARHAAAAISPHRISRGSSRQGWWNVVVIRAGTRVITVVRTPTGVVSGKCFCESPSSRRCREEPGAMPHQLPVTRQTLAEALLTVLFIAPKIDDYTCQGSVSTKGLPAASRS